MLRMESSFRCLLRVPGLWHPRCWLLGEEAFANTTAVQEKKMTALACHKSQHEWLDVSQGMNSYLLSMEEVSRAVGRMSRQFEHAEGWRRHLHLGLSSREIDPRADSLGEDWS